jgi:hypothetical protein
VGWGSWLNGAWWVRGEAVVMGPMASARRDQNVVLKGFKYRPIFS